jgi:hypothetical protein
MAIYRMIRDSVFEQEAARLIWIKPTESEKILSNALK